MKSCEREKRRKKEFAGEPEMKEAESLLTKTILVKVGKDKCENKEEITAILSLKPFTRQVPAQQVIRRRRRSRWKNLMTKTVKKGAGGLQSPLKHSAELVMRRRSKSSLRWKLSSNISRHPPISSCS